MQTQGGVEAEEAITADTRVLRPLLLVDWNKNGLFDHALSDISEFVQVASTDRALKGSAPEELFLIEGAAAAELSFDIGGEYNGLTLVQVFNVFSGASPFYLEDLAGSEVTYSIGVETSIGTAWYPQFTGSIQSFTPSREGNVVSFTALDRVELLRKPVLFPRWSASSQGDLMAAMNQQMQPQWVIDHCLRFCDVSVSPYRPSTRAEVGAADDSLDEGTLYWASLNGSVVPSIGIPGQFPRVIKDAGSGSQYEAWAPVHPESPDPATKPLGTTPPRTGRQAIAYGPGDLVSNPATLKMNAVHYLSFTMLTSGLDWDIDLTPGFNSPLLQVVFENPVISYMQLTMASGNITLTGKNAGSTHTVTVPVPLGNESVRVNAIWDNSTITGSRMYLQVGSNSTGGFQVKGSPLVVGSGAPGGNVYVQDTAGMSDIGYVSRNVYGPSTDVSFASRPATYASVLQRSLNRFTDLPVESGTEAWKVITDVAQSELGSVFWDETGVFHFWNYSQLLQSQSNIVKEITLDDVADLRGTFNLDSVRNVWTVKADKVRNAWTDLFNSSDANEFLTRPLSTETFIINAPDAVSVFTPMRASAVGEGGLQAWVPPGTLNSAISDYVIQWSADGTTGWAVNAARTNYDITPYMGADGEVRVTIRNGYTDYARLATGDTSPAFKLAGYGKKVQQKLTIINKNQPSIDLYGVRNFPVSGEWIQDSYQDNNMVDTLLPRTSVVIPVTDAITATGDPRLQLGDAVRLKGPAGVANDLTAQIYGIRREFSLDGGLTDTLTVEITRPESPGIWGSSPYGRWNQSFIWGPGSQGRWDNTTTGRWDNTMKWYI